MKDPCTGEIVMNLELLDFDITVCKLASTADFSLDRDFYFLARTDEELSLVCRTDDVPADTLEKEDGWRGFRICGVLEFSLIGILSRITGILASNEIGVFAVSTYNTDYILVKQQNLDRTIQVLKESGYVFSK